MEEDSLFQKIRQIFREEEMDDEMKKEAAILIKNMFNYMDKDAKSIMTHRKNIIAVDGMETLEDSLQFMLQQNYSRFPVYINDIDEIIGFLHLRDVISCYLKNEDHGKPIKAFDEYIRPVEVIPETKHIDTLFKEMQATKNHVVLVLDEYGQTSGIVTMEDILEELVGDIFDEHDVVEKMFTKIAPGKYLANGMAELEDIEEFLNIDFDKEEYETLNGFLVNELDHIPEDGEHCVVEYAGYRFTVISVDNNIIERVKIEKL